MHPSAHCLTDMKLLWVGGLGVLHQTPRDCYMPVLCTSSAGAIACLLLTCARSELQNA